MKTYGSGCIDSINLNLSAKLYVQAALPPGERTTSIHWIGGCVEPKNGSGRHGEEKNLYPTGTRTPIPQPSSP